MPSGPGAFLKDLHTSVLNISSGQGSWSIGISKSYRHLLNIVGFSLVVCNSLSFRPHVSGVGAMLVCLQLGSVLPLCIVYCFPERIPAHPTDGLLSTKRIRVHLPSYI